jgi:hypothetical protein
MFLLYFASVTPPFIHNHICITICFYSHSTISVSTQAQWRHNDGVRKQATLWLQVFSFCACDVGRDFIKLCTSYGFNLKQRRHCIRVYLLLHDFHRGTFSNITMLPLLLDFRLRWCLIKNFLSKIVGFMDNIHRLLQKVNNCVNIPSLRILKINLFSVTLRKVLWSRISILTSLILSILYWNNKLSKYPTNCIQIA